MEPQEVARKEAEWLEALEEVAAGGHGPMEEEQTWFQDFGNLKGGGWSNPLGYGGEQLCAILHQEKSEVNFHACKWNCIVHTTNI